MRLGQIAQILGWAFLIVAGAMVLPLLDALLGGPELAAGFAGGLVSAAAVGGLVLTAFRGVTSGVPGRSRRFALAMPVLAFATVPAVAALPLLLAGVAGPGTGYFMMVSAFTTTAATLTPAGQLADPVLLWRAEMAWLGGYAALLMVAAVLSVLNVGGMRLTQSGVIRGESNNLTGTLVHVAAPLAWIYVGFTGIVWVALWVGGAGLRGGLIGAFQAVATAGYPMPGPDGPGTAMTGGAITGAVGPLLLLATFLAGTNLTLLWRMFERATWRVWLRDPEIRGYAGLVFAATGLFAVLLGDGEGGLAGWLARLDRALTHAVAAISTTGLPDAAFLQDRPAVGLLMAVLALTGGCTASTAGGLKVMRVLLLFRQADLELRRLAHPNRVFRLRYAGRAIDRDRDLGGVWQAFLAILGAFSIASLVLSFTGLSYRETVAVVIASVATAGPIAFSIDPGWAGFGDLDGLQRALVCVLMIAGRVEPALIASFFIRRYWQA
ncbi:hypothetical protein CCR85_10210 [Rhodothalassium salexigens]|uniref:TrkH family potassium uptake protein n=1 Tax=Rhodothalassium salexigens TaxID=1086 RepID=UPI001913852C|nr:hypothetical protein [Rhodothalassium salexigens]MBK5922042.1 hypothetical protein [Rhodothalassium salexigens]